MSDLSEILSGLRQEGQLDSSGQFTLDPEVAREKLRRYQLPDRCYYVLKLVQWAVASGARWVSVEVDAQQLSFSHDGRAPDMRKLVRGWGSLEGPEAGLSDLMVGLNAAMGFPGAHAVLRAGDLCLSLNPAYLSLEEARPSSTVQLVLTRKLGWLDWLRRSLPEKRLLAERCAHVPLATLTCNGGAELAHGRFGSEIREVGYEVLGPRYVGVHTVTPGEPRELRRQHNYPRDCLAAQVCWPEPVDKGFRIAAPSARLAFVADLGRDGSRWREDRNGFPCRAALGIRADLREKARVHLLRHGVVVQTHTLNLDVLGLEVLLDGGELDWDLSGFRVVENAVWLGSLAQVRKAALKLVDELLQRFPAASYPDCVARTITGDGAATMLVNFMHPS